MAGSRAAKGVLSELAKRVPKNQLEQFNKFRDLNAKYQARVNKYPEKLPRIDWEDYRTNVRIEAIKMVDEFEKKYEELNKVFDDRVKLDTKKYYDELEKQRAEVQVQVKQYIEESNKRIKAYEAEIARLCDMKPYSSMTIEEFIVLRPEQSHYIPHSRKPLFWPHDPDEQIPGPVGIKKADERGSRGGSGGSGGSGGGSGGSGGGGGGGADSHPIKPSDFKGKTEKFEFNASKTNETKPPAETKTAEDVTAPVKELAPATKPIEAKPTPPNHTQAKSAEAQQVERTEETTQNFSSEREKPEISEVKTCGDQMKPSKSSDKKVAEPKIYIEKPLSEEARKKLDPCHIIEEQNKKEETSADRGAAIASSKPEQKTQLTEKFKAKSREEKIDQRSKPHPCDSVKKTKESIAEKVDTCKTEKKDAHVFFNPCQVTFGLNTNAEVKPPAHTPPKEETAGKSETKKKASEAPPKELKKPLACDLIKKKPVVDEDICKSATSKAPGLQEDKKAETCTFVDPCKTGFGFELKSTQPKALDSKMTKTKSEPKPSTSSHPVAPKAIKSQSCVESQKPIMVAEPGGKDKCKDHSATNVPATVSEGKKGDSCAPTPYYNPFRSEEENRQKEEEACDECRDEVPCAADKRRPNATYYNPFKDDKTKK